MKSLFFVRSNRSLLVGNLWSPWSDAIYLRCVRLSSFHFMCVLPWPINQLAGISILIKPVLSEVVLHVTPASFSILHNGINPFSGGTDSSWWYDPAHMTASASACNNQSGSLRTCFVLPKQTETHASIDHSKLRWAIDQQDRWESCFCMLHVKV